MKHLLKMLDLSKEEILDILNLADQLKYENKNGIGLRMKFFSTISYKNLSVPSEDEGDKVATCKFIFQNSDGVYSCERKDSDGSFYDGK